MLRGQAGLVPGRPASGTPGTRSSSCQPAPLGQRACPAAHLGPRRPRGCRGMLSCLLLSSLAPRLNAETPAECSNPCACKPLPKSYVDEFWADPAATPEPFFVRHGYRTVEGCHNFARDASGHPISDAAPLRVSSCTTADCLVGGCQAEGYEMVRQADRNRAPRRGAPRAFPARGMRPPECCTPSACTACTLGFRMPRRHPVGFAVCLCSMRPALAHPAVMLPPLEAMPP
jgi:hypothetical protein